MGKRRTRRAVAAEVEQGNDEEEASAMPTTMRPMEEERRKAMCRRMMREKERGKENWKNLDLEEIFKFFIELVILRDGTGVLSGYKGAPRVQGCLSHMKPSIKCMYVPPCICSGFT